MDKDGYWGTDKEIHIIASMLQIRIVVSGLYAGEGRRWARFKPLFHNSSCMDTTSYNIYIFHSNDHYDHVVPKLD